MSALGQKQTFASAKVHVRFTPGGGHPETGLNIPWETATASGLWRIAARQGLAALGSNRFAAFAMPSHCLPPRGGDRSKLLSPLRKGSSDVKRCPLWVKSGHVQRTSRCPLCARSGHRALHSSGDFTNSTVQNSFWPRAFIWLSAHHLIRSASPLKTRRYSR